MRLVAARIGQRLNFRTLSGELGISETILKTYLTVLEKTALLPASRTFRGWSK